MRSALNAILIQIQTATVRYAVILIQKVNYMRIRNYTQIFN